MFGPMPRASLNALLDAYQAQINWLLKQAAEFDAGERKVSGRIGGKEVEYRPTSPPSTGTRRAIWKPSSKPIGGCTPRSSPVKRFGMQPDIADRRSWQNRNRLRRMPKENKFALFVLLIGLVTIAGLIYSQWP